MPTHRDPAATSRTRLALFVVTVAKVLGISLYAVTLPAALAGQPDSIPVLLGRIAVTFAAASAVGGLLLAPRLSRFPLHRVVAALSAAITSIIVGFVLVGGVSSAAAHVAVQVPLGLACGAMSAVFPVLFADAHAASSRSAAMGRLASAGGLAAVLGGLSAEILIPTLGVPATMAIGGLCSVPLIALMIVTGRGERPVSVAETARDRVPVLRLLTSTRLVQWLLVGAVAAGILRPLRSLVAPVTGAVCQATPGATGRFVAALALGVACTRLVQRIGGRAMSNLAAVLVVAAAVPTLLAVGCGMGSGATVEVLVAVVLALGGVTFGLLHSQVMSGVQDGGAERSRVGAVSLATTAATLVGGVSTFTWGWAFEALGIPTSLLIMAMTLVAAAAVVQGRRLRRRRGSAVTDTATLPRQRSPRRQAVAAPEPQLAASR